MAVVKRAAHAGALRQRGLAPSGYVARLFENPDDALRIHLASLLLGRERCGRGDLRLQHVDAELQRIFAGGNGAFVDESLKRKRQRIGPRRAQRAGRHAERHDGDVHLEIRHEARRILSRSDVGAGRKLLAFAEGDTVIAERDQPATCVESTGKLMESARTEHVVMHVVFARPEQFDRHLGFPSDPRGFHQRIVVQAAAEATTGTHHVNGDLIFFQAQRRRDQRASTLRRLRGGPQLARCTGHARGAVLRLEWCVGDERIAVFGRDHLGRGFHRGVKVAVIPNGAVGRTGEELLGLGGEGGAGLLRRGMFGPLHDQFLPRLLHHPPILADDGHAGHQPLQVGRALHDERMRDAGHGLDGVEVGALHLRGKHRTLHKRCVVHVGQRDIDAEHGLARHDVAQIDSLFARTDDREVFRVLERNGGQVGRRYRCRRARERAVGGAAL